MENCHLSDFGKDLLKFLDIPSPDSSALKQILADFLELVP